MTERQAGGGGERIPWLLTLMLFGLGVVWLVSSFGSSTGTDTAAEDDAVAETDTAEDDTTAEGDAAAGGTSVVDPNRADRFTISASGDIIIHERVGAEAMAPGGPAFDVSGRSRSRQLWTLPAVSTIVSSKSASTR